MLATLPIQITQAAEGGKAKGGTWPFYVEQPLLDSVRLLNCVNIQAL